MGVFLGRFGRGKSEFKSEYDGLSKAELLDKFKSEEWAKLDGEKRIGVIQALENKSAAEQGRPAAQVVAESGNRYGGYSRTTIDGRTEQKISINVNDSAYNNSCEMLDSYFHESRHAQQYESRIDAQTKEMCELEDTPGNYDQGAFYDINVSEMDSNNYAAEQMLNNKERFQGDREYREYLDRRESHFSKVNEQSKNPSRKARMLRKAENSYQAKHISKGEYKKLVKGLENDKKEPVMEKSEEMEKKVHETRQELTQKESETQKQGNQEKTQEAERVKDAESAQKSEQRIEKTKELPEKTESAKTETEASAQESEKGEEKERTLSKAEKQEQYFNENNAEQKESEARQSDLKSQEFFEDEGESEKMASTGKEQEGKRADYFDDVDSKPSDGHEKEANEGENQTNTNGNLQQMT